MNAYDIEIEYDEENENYYAEHEFAYPSKRVRLNIDTDNSLWPTDESNSMTITIPSNPQTDTNNTWNDTTKTLTLTNLDQNSLITNNQNPTFNYATDLNINLSNYQSSTPSSTKITVKSFSIGYYASSNTIDINSINIQTTSGKITVPSENLLVVFLNDSSTQYEIRFAFNSSNSTKDFNVPANSRYYINNSNNSSVLHLHDENNTEILNIRDGNIDDSYYTILYLRKDKFNLIF